MMIAKIIVVAPTTAVPISTGLAVALKVLPAPSFSSSSSLATLKLTVKPYCFWSSCSMFGNLFDLRQLVDRLRVVGHRAVGVDGNRHRAHAEEAEGHETEREDRRRHHQGTPPIIVDVRSIDGHQVGNRHQAHDGEAEPVGAEVPGHEARQDVERRAAFARRGHDFLDVRRMGRGEDLDELGNDRARQRAAGDHRRQLPPQVGVAAERRESTGTTARR